MAHWNNTGEFNQCYQNLLLTEISRLLQIWKQIGEAYYMIGARNDMPLTPSVEKETDS